MICWTDFLKDGKFLNPLRYAIPRNNIPSVVVWNLTSRCNLNCLHCYFPSSGKGNLQEMSFEEGKDFILDLARVKVPVLLFSGGEPLLREEIFEWARLASRSGIRPILSSNGTLIDRKMAGKIKQAGFKYVGISIDGMEPTNDSFRQKEGAFKLSLEGIRNCRDLGLQVGLRFTLTKYNLKDLEEIFQLMLRESIPRLCIYHLVYSGKGFDLKDADLSASKRRQALQIIWEKTQDALRMDKKIEILTVDNHCDGIWIYLKLREENPALAEKVWNLLQVQGGNASGVKIIAVDNSGNVYPDQFWRTYCLGNIREKKLSQILQDENNLLLRNLRERKKLLKGKCSRCRFLELCNGNLRARAEAVYQDPWQEDPACYFSWEEILSG